MPNEATAKLWVERTGTHFIFDIKAFRLFTMHPTPVISLPKDIRGALPNDTAQKKNIYQRDLPQDVTNELWSRFERALLPLDSAGKLGVVLLQFPPWYYPGDEQRDYILSCKQKLPQFQIAVEFRHNSWINEKNRERTLAFLRDSKLPLVCVDEPQGFKSSVPPIAEITSDITLVRFHGRNRATWEKQGITTAVRFNYLYTADELREWTPRIADLAEKSDQCHVLFNNCHEDKAVNNAKQISLLLESAGPAA